MDASNVIWHGNKKYHISRGRQCFYIKLKIFGNECNRVPGKDYDKHGVNRGQVSKK